jgi:hypothetical protein
MINPWNPLSPSDAASTDQSSQTNWHDAAHLQQRWWTDWLEAGNIWLSWWYSTLPPMPWNPASTVLSAQQVDSSPASEPAPPQHNAATTAPSPSAPPPATAGKSRAQSARHH